MTARPLTFPLGTLGRLGNQLHQIAGTVGIARSQGRPVALPTAWPYRRWFTVPDEWFADDPDAQNAAHIALRLMRCHKRWRPYMQDFSLWEHCADEIRAAFRPSPEAVAEMNRHNFCPAADTLAVHVRRGDYLSYSDDYFPVLAADYYKRAVGTVAEATFITRVDLYTDDPEWAVTNLPSDWQLSSSSRDWFDLLRLGCYWQHVISNSNFGWWGAFLFGPPNLVAFPSVWYGTHINSPWRSLIQPGWVEVPA